MEVVTTHNRCEDHRDITLKIEKMSETINELKLGLAIIKERQRDDYEIDELKTIVSELEKRVLEMELSLDSIEERAERDREDIKELTKQLKLLTEELANVKRDYIDIKEVVKKVSDFIDMNMWYKLSKAGILIGEVLDSIGSKNIFFKYVVKIIKMSVPIFMIIFFWFLLNAFFNFIKQPITSDLILKMWTMFLERI